MQYMLLIYDNEKNYQVMPKDKMDQVMREYREYSEGIVKSGHLRAGSQLQPITTATTVRQDNGKTVTTDGPFAETKEQLGGYYIVEAKNLDEALSLAARVPSVKYGGSIEVRPVVPGM